MTTPEEHLTFSVGDADYAIPVRHVVTMTLMPQLAAVAEAPPFVAGVAEFRARSVPVVDLDARLGREPRAPRASDVLVIVEDAHALVGIVGEVVRDVVEIAEADVRQPPAYAEDAADEERVVTRLASTAQGLLIIPDVRMLIHDPDVLRVARHAGPRPRAAVLQAASPEEAAVLRARADALRETAETPEDEDAEQTGLTVVRIDEERFAIPVRDVRRIMDVRQCVPVPGVPEHVLGVLYARGETVPLLDVRPVLGLGGGAGPRVAAKAVIVEGGGHVAAVAVDDVLDVVDVPRESVGNGEARVGGDIITLLDLRELLEEGGLIVDHDE